jgi:uncharacterized protein YceK
MKTVRLACALPVLIVMVSLAVDTVPRFALGDSAAYLTTAIGGYVPDDRSWAYGLLVAAIIRATRDLNTVAIMQILIAWLGAILLGAAAARYFRIGPWFVVVAVLVMVVNPLDFFWARAFMTDVLAAALLAALVALLFASPRLIPMGLGAFGLTFGLCALRSVYMPPLVIAFGSVAAISLLQMLWATRHDSGMVAAHRQAAIRHLVLTATIVLATAGYASVNGRIEERNRPAVNYATTRFLVSAWSPLMAPSLAALDLPSRVTDDMVPLTYVNRLASAFSPDGIVERLKDHFGSYQAAEPAYDRLLRAALLDNPRDFLVLVAHSWSDYVSPYRHLMYAREMRMTGTNHVGTDDALSPALLARLAGWGIWQHPAPQLPQFPSLGARYYAQAAGYWGILVSMHATLGLLIYLVLPRRNRGDIVLAVQIFALAYMAMLAATTNELIPRYLIPMDIPLLVTLGALFGRRPLLAADAAIRAGRLPGTLVLNGPNPGLPTA